MVQHYNHTTTMKQQNASIKPSLSPQNCNAGKNANSKRQFVIITDFDSTLKRQNYSLIEWKDRIRNDIDLHQPKLSSFKHRNILCQHSWLSINSNQKKIMNNIVPSKSPENIEEEDTKYYELWIHGDQFDLMEDFLEDSNGDVVAALRLYAEFLKSEAQHLDKLAETIDQEISGGAFIDMYIHSGVIDLLGDEEALERIAEMELIERN